MDSETIVLCFPPVACVGSDLLLLLLVVVFARARVSRAFSAVFRLPLYEYCARSSVWMFWKDTRLMISLSARSTSYTLMYYTIRCIVVS